MTAYFIKPEAGTDSQRIYRNGMWYQTWQAGYSDILKKGHQKPRNQDTILAELYSPQVEDFLHGGSGAVPFLISERALSVFVESGFTGYRLASVEIAKITTRGKKKPKISSGEPEDAITLRRDVKEDCNLPTLHAIYITGSVLAVPDYSSGRSPSGYVSPFQLSLDTPDIPDLFRPEFNGKPFSAWGFCSDRFRTIVIKSGLTNIQFQTFEDFMADFRASERKRETPEGD